MTTAVRRPPTVEAQSAIGALERHAATKLGGDPAVHVLAAVARRIVVALASADRDEIDRLVRLTARTVGGASHGATVGVRARWALGVLKSEARLNGSPHHVLAVLAMIDNAFALVDDDVVAAALDKVRSGGSAVGALADVVARCGAFGLRGSRRAVHQRLGKWLAEKN